MPLSDAAISALGSIGGSFLGSGLSGLFNLGSSARAAKKSFKYQTQLMQLQYNLQRQLNQNAYQDATYSMREAGINPMLAITNGASGGSVGLGSVSQNAPQMDLDLAGAFNSAKQLKNDTDRVKNETKIANSTVKKQDYESDLAHEQAALTNEQNRQLQEFGELERKQNLINSAKQADLLDAQKADVVNQILNRNLVTNSSIKLNNSSAKFNNERSRGFTYSTHGPFGIGHTSTGNESSLYNSAKKVKQSTNYEKINGHIVPVKTYSW